MYHLDQQSYPDIEPDIDMVCPNCREPLAGMHVAEMETEYDGDECGCYRYDYVTKWACENCDHEFSECEALSLCGVIEDEETPEAMRKKFQEAYDYLTKFNQE